MRGRTANTSAGPEGGECDICRTLGEEYIKAQRLGEQERANLIRLVLDGHKQARHPQSNPQTISRMGQGRAVSSRSHQQLGNHTLRAFVAHGLVWEYKESHPSRLAQEGRLVERDAEARAALRSKSRVQE